MFYRWTVEAVLGRTTSKFTRAKTCLDVLTAKMSRRYFKVLIMTVAQ